jgi:hypothetical protein
MILLPLPFPLPHLLPPGRGAPSTGGSPGTVRTPSSPGPIPACIPSPSPDCHHQLLLSSIPANRSPPRAFIQSFIQPPACGCFQREWISPLACQQVPSSIFRIMRAVSSGVHCS